MPSSDGIVSREESGFQVNTCCRGGLNASAMMWVRQENYRARESGKVLHNILVSSYTHIMRLISE